VNLTVTPITEAIGARVTGVGGEALPSLASEILPALDRHGVLVFPEVHVSDDDLVALTHALGPAVMPPHGALADHPEITPITRDPATDKLAAYREGTFFWHMDGTTYDAPDRYTLLTARRTPAGGEGDTEFASTYAAYAALPDSEKAAIADLRVRHTMAASQRRVYPEPTEKQEKMWAQVAPGEHPLVWRRRDGRTSMVIGATAEAIVGWTEAQSRALLDHLTEWTAQPKFTLRHQWREGDLVIFDNTGLQHRALPYGASSTRLMHRTTVAGEEPFS
jgi:alpha-ketoglutarate-dependent taurine dioxygenase